MLYSGAMKLIAVIPAYDEERTIADVVARSMGFCSSVVVVDDGSSDSTVERARKAGAVVVRHQVNRGAGAATVTGLRAAAALGARAVVTLDADGQHDPAEISKVVQPIIDGQADVVIGARLLSRQEMPRLTRVFNSVANIVTYLLSGIWCSDSQSGFRAYSAKAVARIQLRSSGFEICSEISREVARCGFRMVEVPVSAIYPPNSSHKGQNYSTGMETVFRLIVRSLMR